MSLSLAGNGTVTGFDASASGFGGLVAVKHALFTGTQVESSVASGADFAVTDLSITHALADSSNKLIISAYLGVVANSSGQGNAGIAVADDGTLIAIGDASSSRSRIAAGGIPSGTSQTYINVSPAVTFVYEPADTASHTFTVRAINAFSSTQTIYVNRRETEGTDGATVRGSSGLVIQEVAV